MNYGMETYNDVYLKARRALKSAGFESPEMEARYIVAHGMGKTREEMLAMSKIYATDKAIREKIDSLLERRLKGEPLAYILQSMDFYELKLYVDKNVLIPRPDTELLVREAIRIINEKVWKSRVLDLCAGSGCIGLAIASKVRSARVVMADISADAMAVCKQNIAECNLSKNTAVMEADVRKPPPAIFGSFDVLVSNPPYIKSADIETLDSSVKDYEPREALDGGEDGYDYYRAICSNWSKVVKPGGSLLFEVGIGQANEVQYLMKQSGFAAIKVYKDTQGIERVVVGMKG